MKYILLSALLLVGAISLHAAEKDTTVMRLGKDPFYLQLYGGVNKSANENLPWSEFSSYPLSVGAFIGLGKEITPVWGWRMAFRYNHNKSRNVRECESRDTWGWDNIGLFADLTFDMADAITPLTRNNSDTDDDAKDYRRWSVKAFAGVGAAYTFGFDNIPLSYQYPYNRNSRVLPAARAGITATYQASRNWRLGIELSNSFFNDNFNGVKANSPIDTRTNLKIGVTYLFTNAKKKVKTNMPVIYDHRLRTVPALPFIIPDAEDVKKRQIAGRAFIDFPVNETVIYPQYRRNPQELKRIIATISNALFDKSIHVTHISLHGYASPESSYSNNTRLSKGRAMALRDYLQKQYGFSASQFSIDNTPEDWDNLQDFIENSSRQRVKGDIWYESKSILETPEPPAVITNNREKLLSIISQDIDLDEKEQKLKSVANGEPYKWLLKYVYPGLRHTDYIIEYTVQQYPVKEARRHIYTHPEALSLSEMYQVANSYPQGSDGWFDALLIAAKQYPDDPTANMNAACACVWKKRLSDAKRYLTKTDDTEQSRYLLDVIAAMEGSAYWKLVNGKVVLLK